MDKNNVITDENLLNEVLQLNSSKIFESVVNGRNSLISYEFRSTVSISAGIHHTCIVCRYKDSAFFVATEKNNLRF